MEVSAVRFCGAALVEFKVLDVNGMTSRFLNVARRRQNGRRMVGFAVRRLFFNKTNDQIFKGGHVARKQTGANNGEEV